MTSGVSTLVRSTAGKEKPCSGCFNPQVVMRPHREPETKAALTSLAAGGHVHGGQDALQVPQLDGLGGVG